MVAAVHELTIPEELGGEIVGAVGDVQAVRETDADGARGDLIDEVTVDCGDAVLGLNRDEDPRLGGLAALAALGLGEPLVVLILRALVAEHDDFLASELDILDAQRGQTLLEDNGDFLGTAADGSDALHFGDTFAADVEGAEIVAVEEEGILTIRRGVELAGPDHRKSVLQSGLVGINHADVEIFHQRRLERGEVRHDLPLALVHRADEILKCRLGRRERMVFQELFGGPGRGALGGRGTHGLDLVGRDSTGAARESFADIRERGGDLLVAEHGTLRRHDDIVALAGDFDRTFHPTEHDLD